MFRPVIVEAHGLIQQRAAIEAMADTLLSDSSDYKLLRRIPNISPINALTILAEAGDLRRFSHHRQFLKFCGLDLATRQSGTFCGQTKLSKHGNARLRHTLWLAGRVAIRQRENGFHDKFERQIARDRHNADAALPLLEASGRPWIVNVSSELASFGLRRNPDWAYADFDLPAYQASKAALNALTLSYTRRLDGLGIEVHAICPGYTATEATNYAGTRTPDQAARAAIQYALLDDDGPTGTFANEVGDLPW